MELSKNAQTIIDLIDGMSAIELNELVKAIEEKFGVTAAATVVAA
jgi:large subunit ribosomal protein L7/L12